MDYLPWGHDRRSRPLVPFLCTDLKEDDICGDAGVFQSWPQMKGWTLESDLNPSTIAKYCQPWLFFGVIRILTVAKGEDFRFGDYVSVQEDQRLDTHAIEELLEDSLPKISELAALLSLSDKHLGFWSRGLAGDAACSSSIWTSGNFNVFWSVALFPEHLRAKYNYGFQACNDLVPASNDYLALRAIVINQHPCWLDPRLLPTVMPVPS